jgi:hypothetical protein
MMTRKRMSTQEAKPKRISDRKHIGSLHSKIVRANTLDRYTRAVCAFLGYLDQEGFSLAQDYEELDGQLCLWIEHLWQDGDGRSFANDTISGVQLYLLTQRKFFGSWKLLSTWKRLELPSRAPPLPPEVALALAGVAVSMGKPEYSAVVLLMFESLLRPQEAFNINSTCVQLQEDLTGTAALFNTKAGQRRGATEMVMIEDGLVGRAVARALVKLPAKTPLVASGTTFRAWFAHALKTLQLTEYNFKLYSCRRGGATNHFRRHRNMALTVERGRWSDVKTARMYITEALSVNIGTALKGNHLLKLYASFLHD